jgi:hypothetical protein
VARTVTKREHLIPKKPTRDLQPVSSTRAPPPVRRVGNGGTGKAIIFTFVENTLRAVHSAPPVTPLAPAFLLAYQKNLPPRSGEQRPPMLRSARGYPMSTIIVSKQVRVIFPDGPPRPGPQQQ